MLIRSTNVAFADNGWVYEQVCLAEMFKFSTNVIGKLAYIPCYNQCGLLAQNPEQDFTEWE